jgi:tetratricopeptide (TPR) repeat protein
MAASVYYAAGDYDRAIQSSRDALELESNSEPARYFLGMALHFAGQKDAAIQSLTEASHHCPALLSGLAFVLAQSGRREAALRIVEEMRERATTHDDLLSPYDFAEAFAGLDEYDRATTYLTGARLPEAG